MPKTTNITKEMIIDAAFEIARADGFSALSARNIAKKIGCSTQPIYWTYENMDILKQDVGAKMVDYLKNIISSYRKTEKPFLDLGLGYVYVAFSEPALFKSLYVDNVLKIKLTDIIPDQMMLEAIEKDAGTKNMSPEQQKEIAVKSWIFTYGLASLIASGVMVYDEEQLEKMLLSIVLE